MVKQVLPLDHEPEDWRSALTGRLTEHMEYKLHLFMLNTLQSPHAEQEVNRLAQDGWTLCSVTGVQSYALIVMQRRVRT